MVVAGDANVWHSTHSTRSCDAVILPFVDLLISSCNLELCNPREQAHISGGGLDCVFILRSCGVPITVHSGNQCCMEAPACCPLLGSDPLLVRCTLDSAPLRDWKPTLPRAHQDLRQWSSRLDAMLLEPLTRKTDRSSTVDDIFVSVITILRTHAPSQRQHPRRRQPAWWTPECCEACVGARRDFRRTHDPRDRSRFCAARVHFRHTVRELPDLFLVTVARPCFQSLPCQSTCRCQCSSPHFPQRAVRKGPDALCPLVFAGEPPLQQ